MELCRQAGIDEIEALCGGCCSCATCHVYLDPEGFEQFLAMSEDERYLLEGSSHRTTGSRLACQCVLSGDDVELQVVIAPEG